MARSSRRGKLLLLGAAVIAAGVLLKRDKVAGLLPSRGQTYEPPPPPPPPGPSNYDAPGPVANTAASVPAPEPQQPEAIDEAAEEAAPTAPGISDSERQIDETIEQAANPPAGEQLEGVRPAEDPRGDAEAVPPAQAPPAEPPPATSEPSAWSPPVPQRTDEPAPFEPAPEEPGGEPAQFEPPTQDELEDKPKDEEGGSDWRTWSGRTVDNP